MKCTTYRLSHTRWRYPIIGLFMYWAIESLLDILPTRGSTNSYLLRPNSKENYNSVELCIEICLWRPTIFPPIKLPLWMQKPITYDRKYHIGQILQSSSYVVFSSGSVTYLSGIAMPLPFLSLTVPFQSPSTPYFTTQARACIRKILEKDICRLAWRGRIFWNYRKLPTELPGKG